MAPSYVIPALDRAFDIIELIGGSPEGVSFPEVVRRLPVPKSTVFRILHTLELRRWVEKREERYFPGDMLIHHGIRALSGRDIAGTARPFLEELMEKAGETAHLAVPSGRNSMILAVVEGRQPIKLTSTPGNLLPLHCTSHGKVFLAHLVVDHVETFYYGDPPTAFTGRTLTDPAELRREIEKIRRQGWAVDDQEYHENVRCCAAPVFDGDGRCIAALGITGTVMTITRDRLKRIAADVVEVASRLSRAMGYTGVRAEFNGTNVSNIKPRSRNS